MKLVVIEGPGKRDTLKNIWAAAMMLLQPKDI